MTIGLLLALLPWATAVPPMPRTAASFRVSDEARFFKPETINQANQQIAEIRGRFGKDVLIETFPTTPADRAKEVKSLGRSKFFALWAEERALKSGVDGVYVLVSKEPRHVEVYTREDAGEPFSARMRENLRKTMVQRFDRKDYDRGLLDGVKMIREQLEQAQARPRSSDWVWIVWVILGILGLWGGIMIVRRFMGPSTAPVVQTMVAPNVSGSAWRHDAPTEEYPGRRIVAREPPAKPDA